MTTVAGQFAQTLKSLGVRYVFGVPSGSMIDYVEAVRQTPGIDFILTSHESGAGYMATVCGRLTGIPGACFATFGPGAANITTGAGAALLDRAPLLVFTDEMPENKRSRTVQMNIDHEALFKPLTKGFFRLTAGKTREMLHRAAGLALDPLPGPVHIGVPSDIAVMQDNEIHWTQPADPKICPPTPQALEQMRRCVFRAEKPVVALGRMAAASLAVPLILKVIETLNVPVVLTPMAKGLISMDHPLYAGVLNHALADRVGKTHGEADLVIGIGYDPVEVNYEEWVTSAPIVHISTVPADLDRQTHKLAADVVGDPVFSLQTLLTSGLKKFKWDIQAFGKRKNRMLERLKPPDGTFGPRAVLHGLRLVLPPDGILTCDVGAHLHLAGQMWPTPSPDCLLMTNGWSSMGFGIPAAIGAKLCRPERKVTCVTGDGGFLMAAGELATARRIGLNIVFVLLSDRDLSLIRIKQGRKGYGAGYGTRLFDSAGLVKDAFLGVPVISARNRDQYQTALKSAFGASGPVIVDAQVSGSEYDDLVLKGNQ